LNEIKLKDDQIFEAKDKAETYKNNVLECQRREEKLKTEVKQLKDELQNYQQQTSRGVSERNDLTMELSSLRTKVVNLNATLDSYKT
jgi:chromosome segregation ATPase